MTRRDVLTAGVLATSTMIAACGGGGGGGAAQELTIVATEGFKYDSTAWTMKSGQSYKVTLQNKDPSLPHTWVVPELGSGWKVRAEANRTASKTLTPNRTGEFKVVCDEAGHTEAGMVGTLTVTA